MSREMLKLLTKPLPLACLILVSFASNSLGLQSEISCEKVRGAEDQRNWGKKCSLTETTVINARGFILKSPRDESIESVAFAYNKQIEFLPDNIYQTYPNLKIYDAVACAIKNISKSNFMNLQKLETIFMDGNLIERLDGDIFEGLSALQEIYLSYNNIKFIDARVLSDLPNLKRFDLFNNDCISKDYKTADEIKTLSVAISSQCQSFSNVCSDEEAKLRQRLQAAKKRIEELEQQLSKTN